MTKGTRKTTAEKVREKASVRGPRKPPPPFHLPHQGGGPQGGGPTDAWVYYYLNDPTFGAPHVMGDGVASISPDDLNHRARFSCTERMGGRFEA
jgi:hypothetical protein